MEYHLVKKVQEQIFIGAFVNICNINQITFGCDVNNSVVSDVNSIICSTNQYIEDNQTITHYFELRLAENIRSCIIQRLNSDIDCVEAYQDFLLEYRTFHINQFRKTLFKAHIQRAKELEGKYSAKPIYVVYTDDDVSELFEGAENKFIYLRKTRDEIHAHELANEQQKEREDNDQPWRTEFNDDDSWMDDPSDYWNID